MTSLRVSAGLIHSVQICIKEGLFPKYIYIYIYL